MRETAAREAQAAAWRGRGWLKLASAGALSAKEARRESDARRRRPRALHRAQQAKLALSEQLAAAERGAPWATASRRSSRSSRRSSRRRARDWTRRWRASPPSRPGKERRRARGAAAGGGRRARHRRPRRRRRRAPRRRPRRRGARLVRMRRRRRHRKAAIASPPARLPSRASAPRQHRRRAVARAPLAGPRGTPPPRRRRRRRSPGGRAGLGGNADGGRRIRLAPPSAQARQGYEALYDTMRAAGDAAAQAASRRAPPQRAARRQARRRLAPRRPRPARRRARRRGGRRPRFVVAMHLADAAAASAASRCRQPAGMGVAGMASRIRVCACWVRPIRRPGGRARSASSHITSLFAVRYFTTIFDSAAGRWRSRQPSQAALASSGSIFGCGSWPRCQHP